MGISGEWSDTYPSTHGRAARSLADNSRGFLLLYTKLYSPSLYNSEQAGLIANLMISRVLLCQLLLLEKVICQKIQRSQAVFRYDLP
jgi:hypothetical protein